MVEFSSQPMAQVTVIVPFMFVLTASCFPRTPVFAMKSYSGSPGALLPLYYVELSLITLVSVTGDVDQSKITSHSDAHLWTKIMA